jgi:peptide/nickel transport system substrate-binding protein
MVQLLAFNHSAEPFKDIRVRRALNYAVNKQEIIQALSPDSPQLDTNFSPVMAFYYNAELENYYPPDPEKAKALLAEAGYGDGLRFTVRVPAEYQFHVDTAQIIQQQFAQVGVTMDIETIEWASWLSEVYVDREHEATIIGLTGKIDPGAIMHRLTSDFYRNFTNYNNPQYDAAVRDAAAAGDAGDRARLYKEAQRLLTEDASHIYIMDPGSGLLMDRHIEGYRSYPVSYIDLRYIVYAP